MNAAVPVLPGRIDRLAGETVLKRGLGPLAKKLMAMSPAPGMPEAHVYYLANRISFAQIYPFLHYRRVIARRHGVALRFLPAEPLIDGAAPAAGGARHVLFQTWFDIAEGPLRRMMADLHAASPDASLDFIDSFAPADLRLGRIVDPHIRFYLKKSLFSQREDHLRVWNGETNIEAYLAETFGRDAAPVDMGVPPSILPKLMLSPNFITAPRFFRPFLAAPVPPEGERPIDVHARLGVAGGIREDLRKLALDRLAQAPGHHLATGEHVPLETFMREMRSSKLCLSPFGFGEICWRDVEAIEAGAVMIKPDMDHLDTLPDLYERDVTYLAVRWDYADLEEVVARALGDADLRARIARSAWSRIHDYLSQDRFLDDMAPLWDAP